MTKKQLDKMIPQDLHEHYIGNYHIFRNPVYNTPKWELWMLEPIKYIGTWDSYNLAKSQINRSVI